LLREARRFERFLRRPQIVMRETPEIDLVACIDAEAETVLQ